jgi:hypothetical protein
MMRKVAARLLTLFVLWASLHGAFAETNSPSSKSIPEGIPVKREAQNVDQGSNLNGQTIVASSFLVFIIMAGAVLFYWKKAHSSPFATSEDLQVLSTKRLSNTHSLYTVRWHGRVMLLGSSSNTLSVLATSEFEVPQK